VLTFALLFMLQSSSYPQTSLTCYNWFHYLWLGIIL